MGYMFLRFIILVFLALLSQSSLALTKVDITQGNIAPLPIAISNFNGKYKQLASNIREIVVNDLENSGLFRIIEQDAYIQELANFKVTPEFASWRQINANALLIADIQRTENETIKASITLWDIFSQKNIATSELETSLNQYRTIAHKMADIVYHKLTGESGYFNTKIAYVSIEDGNGEGKLRKIAIMDQDGHNTQYLTEGDQMVLTPRFSPDGKKILYLSYPTRASMGKPKIWLMDIHTKKRRMIGEFSSGMSFSPRYMQNSKKALIAIEKAGISNVYVLDVDSMATRQVTKCSSICVSPSASPHQDKIVFNSDMGGGRHLYTINFDGSNAKRISFGEGNYSAPVWSPRGDLIAFTKMMPGEGFFIGVMRSDGTGERILAKGWLVEGATWSPNGRVIMFEKESGPRDEVKLYTIDITGTHERMIDTPTGASDPSWSNLY